MSKTGNGNIPTPNELVPKAPSYNELFNTVNELTERLRKLESAAGSQPAQESSSDTASAEQPWKDFRMLPDLNRAVPMFTGHENSCAAEDWIGSVDALSTINNWPTPYRLQYAKSNLSNAARSWYLTEIFADWSDFITKFRAVFVRTPRMTDRWKALSDRIQRETEHIADYYYDKLRLCQSLQLAFTETRE